MCKIENIAKEIEKEIINKLRKEDLSKKCPDHKVATIKWNDNKLKFGEDYILKEKRKNSIEEINIKEKGNNKRIVVILESPHNDEFNDDITGPALGVTGKKFEKYFLEIFNDYINKSNPRILNKDDECEIILMNAIQYKASLGFNTEMFRDRVWLTLWSQKEIRECFASRLKEYEPYIIINLCTDGSHMCDICCKSKNINYEFIKEVASRINQDIDGNLKIDNEIIYNVKYCDNAKNQSRRYKLDGFIQTKIDSLREDSMILLDGIHPAGWRGVKDKDKDKDNGDNIKEIFKLKEI
ncbi:MAG: hypothetical protein E6441_12865 [Clostridium sp.]|uniref:hypothetical protein n=1 Tax=Clostridium sp. TaxID=1506 RepID=UPI00291584C6|nr:hypothetical protein [Clostridium sp.]MDU4787622.1 hypothetical protein [Clostridium sp.]MDU5210221.1 hypothetical protein [Clostridium sp.]MDU6762348.1 hypothetical protein [Clostridium sp.]